MRHGIGGASRRGKKRALVAVGHTVLLAMWAMLTHDMTYRDLGGDYFTERLNPQGKVRQARRLVSQLALLGYQVVLQPAAPA
jgi:transposase